MIFHFKYMQFTRIISYRERCIAEELKHTFIPNAKHV